MAQLNSVIGSILRDIISAQHEANLYTLSLSESYGKDGKAKNFQLPNVVISDMELDLKYGIVSASENQEQQNIKYSKFRRFIKELCNEAAKTTITSAVSTVLTSDIHRNEEDKRFFYHLKQEEELNKKFHSFLMRNMRIAFDGNLHESLDAGTGTVIVDVVVNRLMGVIRKKFLQDTDLTALFEGADGKSLKTEIETATGTALTDLVKTMSEGQSFKRVKRFPQLDIAVTADELEKMPEDAIHSFKLKFNPTVCNIADSDNDDDLDNFVMD